MKLHVSRSSDTDTFDKKVSHEDDIDNLPRFLCATFAEEGEKSLSDTFEEKYPKFYKKWDMNQVNPDPVLNESKKSIISSFEHMYHGVNEYWCTESVTIANRMS